jgi:integrase
VELCIRHVGETGLMPSSIDTMMHGVRGFFRCAHIDGRIPADPAVYARLPKVHHDESRTPGLDRLELIRFLQVAQAITVHHGPLAQLLGNNALRASEAATVRIEDYRETLRGHRVLHLVGKGNKPAADRPGPVRSRGLPWRMHRRTWSCPGLGKSIDRRDCYRMVSRIAKAAGIPRHISPHTLRHAAITNALDAGVPLRDAAVVPGQYVTGWIKRCPTGVIGTNMKDLQETVAALLVDASSLPRLPSVTRKPWTSCSRNTAPGW